MQKHMRAHTHTRAHTQAHAHTRGAAVSDCGSRERSGTWLPFTCQINFCAVERLCWWLSPLVCFYLLLFYWVAFFPEVARLGLGGDRFH